MTIINFSILARIDLSIDGAIFRSHDEQLLWEFYYSYKDNNVRYNKVGDKYHSNLKFQIIFHSAISEKNVETWSVVNQVDSLPKDRPTETFIGQRNFVIKPGIYEIDLTIVDLNDTSNQYNTSFRLIARQTPKNSIALSDIQLARVIESESQKSVNWMEIFNKNSLFVIPNPTLEYYNHSPQVLSYVEVYNAKKFAPEGYNIYYSIYNALRKNIFTSPGSSIPISDGMVEIAELPVELLPTGKYYLEIKVTYPLKKANDSSIAIKPFYFINSEIPPEQVRFVESELFEQSEFATMYDDEVKQEYDKIKYIATREEIDRYENLTELEAKRRFLFAYWKIRDPNPETPLNERLIEFRKAIDYANKHFVFGKFKDGWRTERGRILLIYGFPTYVERHQVNAMEKAYEIWRYDNLQGGIAFYFVDVMGLNNYILVHSTAYGEIFNKNWYNEYVPIDVKKKIR